MHHEFEHLIDLFEEADGVCRVVLTRLEKRKPRGILGRTWDFVAWPFRRLAELWRVASR